MNRIAGRARMILVLALLLLGGTGFFLSEFFTQSEKWVVSPGSPHVFVPETRTPAGRVTDRDGVPLLGLAEERTYASDAAVRRATLHWLGDRAGNISAPALTEYAKEMAGFDRVNGVYVYGDADGVARLTLSAQAQAVALAAMGSHKGTVAVYNYKTGELLCAVSTPNFDPDHVPDIAGDTEGLYEGVYLNRFTQSVYIPGSIFKIVTLAAALESIPDIREQTFTCTGSYKIGENAVTCEGVHGTQTLKEAFCNSCNCAFAQISQQLGKKTLTEYVEKFHITDSLTFDGITTARGNYDLSAAGGASVAWSAIGQYTDQINPCRYMAFLGAIANGGKGTMPHLVDKISVGGKETYRASTQWEERIMSEETAATVQEYLLNNVENKYGAENFPGLTVGAKTGTGEVGGEKKPNAMFTGFVADPAYPLAFIVTVEDGGYGKTVCVPILAQVLAACVAAMDR